MATKTKKVDDIGVHMTHCNQGECEGVCAYGEADCPAVTPLNSKQLDGLRTWIESRLGTFGVKWYEHKEVVRPKSEHIKVSWNMSLVVDRHSSGIFMLALKDMEVAVNMWKSNKKERGVISNSFHGSVKIGYTHIPCGSNGCDLKLEFYLHDDGRITEVY